VAESGNDYEENRAADERVEELTRELADRIRSMPNRQELTDYAVSLLKESNEQQEHAELVRDTSRKAGEADAFNPIAFGIPLFVIGAVLCATGILIGPGLGVMAIAAMMVLYGFGVSVFSRRRNSDGT